jgi:acyl-CoA thioesterase-1
MGQGAEYLTIIRKVQIGILGALGACAAFAGGSGGQTGRTLLFFGDSITAGYGLGDPAREAYPALIREKISAAGLRWKVVDAGLSGDTTAGGLRRVDWVLREPVDAFVLALGGNDGLRGIPPPVTEANLKEIIARVRSRNPEARVVLAGMQMPPNMGEDYDRAFARIFPSVARAAHAALIPFLLDGVGGREDLNQPDGIHPTAAGHRIVAENVWRVIEPMLRQ